MSTWTQLELFAPETREELQDELGYGNTDTPVRKLEEIPPEPGAGYSDAPEHTRDGSTA